MKKIILTGASDGLGREFAKLCIENNIKIVALCRTKPNYDCDFIQMDLTSESITAHLRFIRIVTL